MQLGNAACDLHEARLEHLLGDEGGGAGCGTGPLALISGLDAVLVLGLVPGMLLVVTGLDKSPFVIQREYSFSLKHFLFGYLGPPLACISEEPSM